MRTSLIALTIAIAGCSPAQTPTKIGSPEAPNLGTANEADDGAMAAVTPIGAVDIDVSQLANARAGDAFELDLGPAGRVATRTLSVERLEGGRFSWTARTLASGGAEGEATLVVDGAAITGSVRTPEGVLYRIKPYEQGNWIERVETERMPPD